MTSSADGKTPIIRRQIIDEVRDGSFSSIMLMHMAHYDVSAHCMIEEAARLERPIDVLNVGAGDLWDLRVLVHGLRVSKPAVLRSYYAVDAVHRDPPFGAGLRKAIQYTSIVQDIMQEQTLPLEDSSIDLVICTEFIEHVTKQAGVSILQQMYRVLRSGGFMYLTTPNADNSTRSDKYHIYEWPLEELKQALVDTGFEVHACYGTFMDQKAFIRANAKEHRIPEHIAQAIKDRFTPNFFRVILATVYPEYSTGVALYIGKS